MFISKDPSWDAKLSEHPKPQKRWMAEIPMFSRWKQTNHVPNGPKLSSRPEYLGRPQTCQPWRSDHPRRRYSSCPAWFLAWIFDHLFRRAFHRKPSTWTFDLNLFCIYSSNPAGFDLASFPLAFPSTKSSEERKGLPYWRPPGARVQTFRQCWWIGWKTISWGYHEDTLSI